MASVFYQLHETQGQPPMPAGGWLVGAPGDTAEDLAAILRRQYGGRLARIETKDGHAIHHLTGEKNDRADA